LFCSSCNHGISNSQNYCQKPTINSADVVNDDRSRTLRGTHRHSDWGISVYTPPPPKKKKKSGQANFFWTINAVRTVVELIPQWESLIKFYTSPKLLYLPKTNFWLRLWVSLNKLWFSGISHVEVNVERTSKLRHSNTGALCSVPQCQLQLGNGPVPAFLLTNIWIGVSVPSVPAVPSHTSLPLGSRSTSAMPSAHRGDHGPELNWSRLVESHRGARENIIAGLYYTPILYVLRSRRRWHRQGGNVGRVSPHHWTRGAGERRNLHSPTTKIQQTLDSAPAGSGAENRPKIDFMHILGQKEAVWNTIFSIFEWRRGPQTSRGPRKLPLSTGLNWSK